MRLESIIEILKEHERELKEKYGVKSIGIFGSYVRGQQRKDSDLDVLVEFERSVDFFEFLELEEYLSSVLRVKVDLVPKKSLRPEIAKNVLKEVVYV